MDNHYFIIEILKFGAWPFVACLAIFFLKDKFGNVFSGGVKSAKHGNTEIQFYESEQAARPISDKPQNLQNFIPVDPTGLRDEFEKSIVNQLNQISGDAQKIDILVKNLAQNQISISFDKAYYNIYGSQIRLLEYLSTQDEGKSTVSSVVNFFDMAKVANPELYKDWQFSNYMAFLVSWGFVINESDCWVITTHGRAFITYITALNFNKNKPF